MNGENCVKADTAKGDIVAHRGVGSHFPYMMAVQSEKAYNVDYASHSTPIQYCVK